MFFNKNHLLNFGTYAPAAEKRRREYPGYFTYAGSLFFTAPIMYRTGITKPVA